MTSLPRQWPPCRGVSLVEALVALAVMSIGMLALVGVQSTMRLNSDLSKQRTEATRIASEEIERLRSFTSVADIAGQPGLSFYGIKPRVIDAYQPPDNIGNASYRVVRRVTPDPDVDLENTRKLVSVQVQVEWLDRLDATNSNNLPQKITLDSVISATAPALGAMLMLKPPASPLTFANGRHVSIPGTAVPVTGDPGQSVFSPPGGNGATWYFNNVTGEMQACASGVNDPTTCPNATLVSGTVQFHIATSQPGGAAAEQPAGPVAPLKNGPNALELALAVGSGTQARCYSQIVDQRVQYFCAMTTDDPLGWGGQLKLALANGEFSNEETGFKSCRYTGDLPSEEDSSTRAVEADPHAQYTLNADHPLKYCLESPRGPDEAGKACTGKQVRSNLINQNFLVIKGNQSCPTEWDSQNNYIEAGSRLVRANTRQHQPNP